MDSIYQLKTGEFVDLNRIVKVGKLTQRKKLGEYQFDIIFQLVQNIDKVAISLYHVDEEMTAKYDEELNKRMAPDYLPRYDDKPPHHEAREIAFEIYTKFSQEVYNDFINAWINYKKEKEKT